MSNQYHHHYRHKDHRKYPKYHHHNVYRKRSEASHALSYSLPLHCNGDLSSSWLDAQKGQRTGTLALLQYPSTFPSNTTGAPKPLTSFSVGQSVESALIALAAIFLAHCAYFQKIPYFDASRQKRVLFNCFARKQC